MSLEPQDAYTVLRRAVLPPPAPVDDRKIIVPYEENVYARMLAEEADRCNRRMWEKQGRAACGGSAAQDINISRHRQAVADREALAAKALALITKRPRTSADLRELLHVSENRIRTALGLLKAQGRADFERRDGFAFWGAV